MTIIRSLGYCSLCSASVGNVVEVQKTGLLSALNSSKLFPCVFCCTEGVGVPHPITKNNNRIRINTFFIEIGLCCNIINLVMRLLDVCMQFDKVNALSQRLL